MKKCIRMSEVQMKLATLLAERLSVYLAQPSANKAATNLF